ncbi:uncharacterized protein LOC141628824 [Silene latifolia]|uniref:uncharacterized protein LOC141628824 n=1 Tax=Silene latifolia TaxID=37657 RepID=UPI003D76DBF4
MVTRFVTPGKRFVRMHRQEGDMSGYSVDTFDAHSYKEILTSPSKKNGTDIERTPLWDHLRRFAGQADGPWAMAGDFNCVLSATERVGGNTTNAKIEPFRSCIDDGEVVDIQATGSLFTWNNKQQPVDRIYSRLDRFMINKAWSDHFPELYDNFLPEGMMDHTPCLIFSSMQVQNTKSFKY